MGNFKHYLRQITQLYLITSWDCDAFIIAQRLRDDLLTARNYKGVTNKEYIALYPLVNHLINEMQDTLKKNGKLG